VTRLTESVIRTAPLGGGMPFIDCDALGLDKTRVKWVLENATIPVAMMVRNVDALPKPLPKNAVLGKGAAWGEAFNLFGTLDLILLDPDRGYVLRKLIETAPPPTLIFNYLVSNVDKLRHLRGLLCYLDEAILQKKPDEWFYEFLAFGMKPMGEKVYLKYRIGKG